MSTLQVSLWHGATRRLLRLCRAAGVLPAPAPRGRAGRLSASAPGLAAATVRNTRLPSPSAELPNVEPDLLPLSAQRHPRETREKSP